MHVRFFVGRECNVLDMHSVVARMDEQLMGSYLEHFGFASPAFKFSVIRLLLMTWMDDLLPAMNSDRNWSVLANN